MPREDFLEYFLKYNVKKCYPKSKKWKALLLGSPFLCRFVELSYLKPDRNKPCCFACVVSSDRSVVHKSILVRQGMILMQCFLVPCLSSSIMKVDLERFFVLNRHVYQQLFKDHPNDIDSRKIECVNIVQHFDKTVSWTCSMKYWLLTWLDDMIHWTLHALLFFKG